VVFANNVLAERLSFYAFPVGVFTAPVAAEIRLDLELKIAQELQRLCEDLKLKKIHLPPHNYLLGRRCSCCQDSCKCRGYTHTNIQRRNELHLSHQASFQKLP